MSISTEPTKQPNLVENFTNEQVEELRRCHEDPLYFIKNYMQIQHATRGAISFVPFPFQEEMIRAFNENIYTVCLTARQCGKTTCAGGFLLWKAMFTESTTILIVANNYNGALEIMQRVRYTYENLPDFLRPGIKEYNKGSVTFDNGSRIVSRATSPDAARGLSISLLYCLAGDETVTVRDKQTGLIRVVSLQQLHAELAQ